VYILEGNQALYLFKLRTKKRGRDKVYTVVRGLNNVTIYGIVYYIVTVVTVFYLIMLYLFKPELYFLIDGVNEKGIKI